eukprot:2625569-Amphidinium_carterae.1
MNSTTSSTKARVGHLPSLWQKQLRWPFFLLSEAHHDTPRKWKHSSQLKPSKAGRPKMLSDADASVLSHTAQTLCSVLPLSASLLTDLMNKQLQDNGFKREVSVSYVRTLLMEIGYKWKKRVHAPQLTFQPLWPRTCKATLFRKFAASALTKQSPMTGAGTWTRLVSKTVRWA